MAIDWNLARIPDFVGNAMQQQAGYDQERRQQEAQNALMRDRADERQYQRGRDRMQDQRQTTLDNQAAAGKSREELKGFLVNSATALLTVPAETRAEMFKSKVAPGLQQMFKVDPATIDKMAMGDFSDATLISLVGQDPRPKAPNAPSGFMPKPDGTLAFIPGGPADPAVYGTRASVNRDAVVSRPMPSRASGGGGSGGGGSILPPGYVSR